MAKENHHLWRWRRRCFCWALYMLALSFLNALLITLLFPPGTGTVTNVPIYISIVQFPQTKKKKSSASKTKGEIFLKNQQNEILSPRETSPPWGFCPSISLAVHLSQPELSELRELWPFSSFPYIILSFDLYVLRCQHTHVDTWLCKTAVWFPSLPLFASHFLLCKAKLLEELLKLQTPQGTA